MAKPLEDPIASAMERLLEVARHDTGQSRRIADFLLAWWNAPECGGFDPTDLWGLDTELRVDIATTFLFIAGNQHYPDTLGYQAEFDRMVRRWLPHLLDNTTHAT